ncbi:MAG: hypothetical protein IH597_13400 [Bacteroidales bacterium]|nr:hypothetical protein [Bacteroidales bacterium]
MKQITHSIKTVALVFSLFLASLAVAQTAVLSLDSVTSCPGSDITITLHVEDFLNVGAITLYVGYDTAVLEYDGHGNLDPQFMGLISNPVTVPTTQVNIVWSSTTAGNISNGTLLELYFIYKGGSSDLTFNPNCDLTSVNLLPIPFTTQDGSAIMGPHITANPENTVVTAGNNATFSVVATGASTYQWQEFDGAGWYDLQNGAGYQNVNGSELTVVQAPVELDGYWYRCFLADSDTCVAMSDSAMLTVLPELTAMLALPSVGSCPDETVAVPVQGFALEDVIEFGIFISYNPSVASFTGLANVNPVIEGATASVQTVPVPHLQISWSAALGVSIPDGLLFELVFDFNQGTTPLIFMAQSFVLSADQIQYILSTINGQISTFAVPAINSHPSNLTIYSGSDANFTVVASGAEQYQWYESQDNGTSWDILQNQGLYSGVETPALTLTSVPLAYDEFQYKCLVSSLHCDIYSNAALLNVDTLTSVNDFKKPESKNFNLITYQLEGQNLKLTYNLPSSGILNIRLYDLTGKMIQLEEFAFKRAGKEMISLGLKGEEKTGLILMQSQLQTANGEIYITTNKILRFR